MGAYAMFGRPSIRQLFPLNNFFSRMATGISCKLGTYVPYGVQAKCCYFYVDPKSKMAALCSDSLSDFRTFLENGCRDLLKIWHTYSLWVPDQVLLLISGFKIQDGRPFTFSNFLMNGCKNLLQSRKCFLWGPDQVLLLLYRSEIQGG